MAIRERLTCPLLYLRLGSLVTLRLVRLAEDEAQDVHALLGVRCGGREHVRVIDEACLGERLGCEEARLGQLVREIVAEVLTSLRISGSRGGLEEDPVAGEQPVDVGEDVADVRQHLGAELPATSVVAVSTGDETT